MQQSVIHLVSPAEVGGLESAVHVLAAAQRARGHDVRVLASIGAPNAATAWISGLRASGVPVLPLVSSRIDYVAHWRRIKQECVAYAPDVVHTHGYRADVLGADAARAAGCRTVTTVHGFKSGAWKHRMYEHVQRRAFVRFDAVVAVSRGIADELHHRLEPGRLHVVPNAFATRYEIVAREEARAALGLPPSEFRVGWVGRLSYETSADLAIRALSHDSAAGVMLSIIGDGAARKQLERRASTLGVADRIAWHGVRYDAPALLRAFDALVISSRTEGAPIVLLEAMAAGVPIIATRAGAVADIVCDEHALLVPPEQPAAIAHAIDTVRHGQRAARYRAWRAAQRVASQFSIDPWLDHYERIYDAVARSGARTRCDRARPPVSTAPATA